MKASTRAIVSLIKHNKSVYIVDAIVMLIANACEACLPLLFGLAIGAAASTRDLSPAAKYLTIAWLLNVAHMIFWHVGDYWVIKRVHLDTYKLREIAYRTIWRYDYAKFIDLPSSKIAANANHLQNDLRMLYESFHYGFYSIGTYYLVLAASISTIAWQNGLVYLGFLLIAATVLAKRTKLITQASATFTDELSNVDGKVFDSFANYTNVFSFNAKRKEVARNTQLVKTLFSAHYKSERTNIDFWTIASVMVRWLLWAAILSLNFSLLKRGRIDQAGFAAAVSVLVSFTGSYWNLVHHISMFGKLAAAFNQNYSYLFDDDIVANHYHALGETTAMAQPTLKKSLSFASVSFAYPDVPAKTILSDLSFEIRHQEKIGVVGQSGGGKSTLVKLLLGFYDPTQGKILVDDHELDKDGRSQLVSYVPQDTTLFQETVAYNIGYAMRGDVSRAQIIQAAEKAHAHAFISQLPDGYDTLVGERGVKLSLGQRQRIALARAFLKDTELLILDEATSSLDSKTEKDIQDSLELLWQHKTVIAIAHRLSTLNNVDRILVIDNGRIVESGTKQQLLEQGGKFKELWDHQKDGLI